ncbi:mitochondrial 37s ribosomal protein mrp4 [Diplodia corticola]|uniref:Mitochondrial 37s ribosomal protein mrp4 n=1 Tax=Diplodia corticola TaxID=236234 RepID=A0A1J9R9B4_9PEZI|nr:mitochondrial 37s ribosomal protein mrp4 [Diplodia corticola]OJD38142.1 mitochondrial 37s ribosomal protein mrp4 [Diplodia corticola]
MIVRRLAARTGRNAFAHGNVAAAPARQWRRSFASDVDLLEHSAENSLKETRSIETALNSSMEQPVPTFNPNAARDAALTDPTVAENWYNRKHLEHVLKPVGTAPEPHYQPHRLLTNPPRPQDVTLELLLASQAHLGHATSVWKPANARYIFGIRDGIHIISLDQTAAYLRRAAKVVTEVCKRGGLVLFVGTRNGQDRSVVKAAQLAKGCHLFDRWIPGSVTNGQQILGRCQLKVVDELDREMTEFADQLVDRAVLKPDLVVCLNPLENYVLLHECGLNHIPTIGIIDTDADSTWVTYPIPANDDSLRCTDVIAGVLGRAGEEGQKIRLEAARQGVVTYRSPDRFEAPEQFTSKNQEAAGQAEKPVVRPGDGSSLAGLSGREAI